jgi:hypothetical protein
MIRLLFLILVFISAGEAQIMNDIDPAKARDGQFVRVTRNQDGSKTILRRTPNNEVIEKRTFSANGNLTMLTVYRMDKNGNPMNCQIYDGLKQQLFKARYGYDANTGLLVEEQLFDTRVKFKDPTTGEESPVRRFIYTYDANGKANMPMSIVLRPGKMANDVFLNQSSHLGKNPFKKDLKLKK